jgi:hypothetical protein
MTRICRGFKIERVQDCDSSRGGRKERTMKRSITLIVLATLAVSTALVSPASSHPTERTGIHAHDHLEEATPAGSTQASAEPDRTATLNSDNPKFTWESSGSGVDPLGQFGCTGESSNCEYVLLNVETAGELTLTLDNTSDVSDPTGGVCVDLTLTCLQDIDARLYKSNASGEPMGDSLTDDCITVSASETCKVAVGPGFYLVEVEYYVALDASYIGTAELNTAAPPPPSPPTPDIAMEGCHMTVHMFKDSAERLSEWVPDTDRYSLQGTVPGRPDQAFLAFWLYSCRNVSLNGGNPHSAKLSLVGVVVRKPVDRGGLSFEEDPTGFSNPTASDHYLVWAHTDYAQLATRLSRLGMPVDKVRQIEFDRPNDFDAFTSVISRDGSYSTAMHGWKDDDPHSHDNSFWYNDRRLGEAELRLQIGSLLDPIADDWSCKAFFFTQEDPTPCSTVSAEHGSHVASLLGASTRDDAWAANHLEFDAIGSINSYGDV